MEVLRDQSQASSKDTHQQSGQGPSQTALHTTDSSFSATQCEPHQGQSTSTDLYGAAIMNSMIAEQQQLTSAQAPTNTPVATPGQPQEQHHSPAGMILKSTCPQPLVSQFPTIMTYATLSRAPLRKKQLLEGKGCNIL